jgi:hypothetical protein
MPRGALTISLTAALPLTVVFAVKSTCRRPTTDRRGEHERRRPTKGGSGRCAARQPQAAMHTPARRDPRHPGLATTAPRGLPSHPGGRSRRPRRARPPPRRPAPPHLLVKRRLVVGGRHVGQREGRGVRRGGEEHGRVGGHARQDRRRVADHRDHLGGGRPVAAGVDRSPGSRDLGRRARGKQAWSLGGRATPRGRSRRAKGEGALGFAGTQPSDAAAGARRRPPSARRCRVRPGLSGSC